MQHANLLSIPDADLVENPATLTSLRELRSWSENLPLANLPRMAEEMLEALQLLNRHPVKLGKRPDLMLCFLPPFRHLLGQIETAPPGHLQAICRALARELAFGFKLAIRETGGRGSAKSRAQLYYYAACTLAQELLLDYSCYRPPATHCWPEILAVYRIAEQQGCERTPVRDLSAAAESTGDLLCLVKRTGLIMLLDPLRLQPGAVWAARDYIDRWCGLAELAAFTPPAHADGRFLVDPDGDGKPQPFDAEQLPAHSGHLLLLDASALNLQVNRQLKERLQSMQPTPVEGLGERQQLLATQLLRQMLLGWHVLPERRHPREVHSKSLQVACGIGAVHHFMQAARRGQLSEPFGDNPFQTREGQQLLILFQIQEQRLLVQV